MKSALRSKTFFLASLTKDAISSPKFSLFSRARSEAESSVVDSEIGELTNNDTYKEGDNSRQTHGQN